MLLFHWLPPLTSLLLGEIYFKVVFSIHTIRSVVDVRKPTHRLFDAAARGLQSAINAHFI